MSVNGMLCEKFAAIYHSYNLASITYVNTFNYHAAGRAREMVVCGRWRIKVRSLAVDGICPLPGAQALSAVEPPARRCPTNKTKRPQVGYTDDDTSRVGPMGRDKPRNVLPGGSTLITSLRDSNHSLSRLSHMRARRITSLAFLVYPHRA